MGPLPTNALGIYRSIDPKVKSLVDVEFKPMPDSKHGELLAQADIVVGLTPEETERRRPGGRRPGGPPPRRPRQ